MNSGDGRVKLIAVVLLCAIVVVIAAAAAPAAKVDIHGFILNRLYYKPGAAHFEVERISLQASAPITDDVSALVEWYFHQWAPSDRLWLESAYVDFKDKCNGRLRVGKGRSYAFGITPTGGMRKMSEYGLVSEAFTQDRVTGLQYNKTDKKGVAWGLGVYNGYNLGSRPVSDGHAFQHVANSHLCDRENTSKDVLEVSGRVTKKVIPELELGLSIRGGKLSPTDVTFVQQHFNSAWTSRTKMRYGLDAVYRGKSGLISNAELYLARTSELNHMAYALLVGYEPKNPNAMKAYARWGVSNLDLSAADVSPGSVTDQLTFDNEQLMFSLVQPIRPGVWVEIAYIANDQDPLVAGVSLPENDIGFVELFTGF